MWQRPCQVQSTRSGGPSGFRATRRIRLTFFRATDATAVSIDEITVYPLEAQPSTATSSVDTDATFLQPSDCKDACDEAAACTALFGLLRASDVS